MADPLIPNHMSDFSNSSNIVSYCSHCGGITMNIQASGFIFAPSDYQQAKTIFQKGSIKIDLSAVN